MLGRLETWLVDDWHQAWRWASVRALAVALALQGALLAFPDTLHQYLPDWLLKGSAIFLLLAATIGRLVKQRPNGGSQ